MHRVLRVCAMHRMPERPHTVEMVCTLSQNISANEKGPGRSKQSAPSSQKPTAKVTATKT